MENHPKHHVYFAVFGFGDDPTVVTRTMGIAPTKAWVKGEPLANSRHWYEFNPGFRFTASVVQRVAALGLDVDFDLYFLGGSDADSAS